MTGKRQNHEQTVERERRVWELRQQWWTHERIAEEVGIDRSTVTKMLGRISKRYSEMLLTEVDRLRVEQVVRLEYMADQAMQAWASSKQPAKDARRRKRTGVDEVEENRVQTQNADPRFLGEARAALGDIRKLLGLDAPAKIAPTDPSGDKEYGNGSLTDEQRAAKIAALLDAARARADGSAP